jgi:hypothetical protein
MRALTRLAGPACAASLLLAGLTGCGDDTKLPQAAGATAFTSTAVAITQQGNADVSIDNASIMFVLDDTRSLVVHLSLTSHASKPVTVSVRASLYDPKHNLVGDAVGGQINVQPGQVTAVQLSGPTPLGTIASAVFEASTQASPS